MFKSSRISWPVIIIGLTMINVYLFGRNAFFLGVLLFLLLLLFFKVSIQIDQEYIKITLGLGLIDKKISLREIKSCKVISNPWLAVNIPIGFGPGWRVYNAWGIKAVEIEHSDRKIYRIGYHDPEELCRFIHQQIKRLPELKMD